MLSNAVYLQINKSELPQNINQLLTQVIIEKIDSFQIDL